MGKHRRESDRTPQEMATGDPGATYWSVDSARWPSLRPSLPAEMVDLLAPPIVVGVARAAATSRLTSAPEAEARTGAPHTPGPVRSSLPAGRPVPVGATTVRFAVASHPAGPAGSVPGGAPAPGRHRDGHGPLDRNR